MKTNSLKKEKYQFTLDQMCEKIITIVENGGEFILSKEELIEEFGMSASEIVELFQKIKKSKKVKVYKRKNKKNRSMHQKNEERKESLLF